MYHQGPPLHYFGILDMHFLGLEFEAYVLISMSEISRETLDGDSESERRPQICMVWYGMLEAYFLLLNYQRGLAHCQGVVSER